MLKPIDKEIKNDFIGCRIQTSLKEEFEAHCKKVGIKIGPALEELIKRELNEAARIRERSRARRLKVT